MEDGLVACNSLPVLLRASYYNNDNLQAFQLIVLARYLLGVPEP